MKTKERGDGGSAKAESPTRVLVCGGGIGYNA